MLPRSFAAIDGPARLAGLRADRLLPMKGGDFRRFALGEFAIVVPGEAAS